MLHACHGGQTNVRTVSFQPVSSTSLFAALDSALSDRGRDEAIWRTIARTLVFGLLYGLAAKLGLAYSSLSPNVTLIWAPTGISLFAVLRYGNALWPGIVLGDLIANAGTGAPVLSMLGISAGNIAQTLGCAWALRRADFRPSLARVRDVVALLTLGTAGAAISAFIGPASLALGDVFPWSAYPSVWLQWLMGDATGVVVLAPFLLAWWRPRIADEPRRWVEALLLLASLALLCGTIFGDLVAMQPGYYPASLALFPLAVWAALRFGLRGATLLTALVSVAAVWGTVRGHGPFVDAAETSSLLRWWLFANVITVTSLLLAASQSERDMAQTQAIRDRDFSSAVLDAEGALVLVLDAGWRVRRVNRSFELLSGFSLAELENQRFDTALVPAEQHDKFAALAELLRLQLSQNVRHDGGLRRRAGAPLTVSWSMSALRDARGRIEHVIVSGIDISARVEAIEALRQARRTLEARVVERTQALAAANDELQVQIAERRRLEHEIIHVSEREQMRFGQELHDGLGQHLTATAIQAELLAQDLQALGAGDASASAERIEAMLSDAVSQTRLLARGLYPVELEDNGLMAALRQLAAGTQSLALRQCALFCPTPVDVREHTVAIHLYRIAQEAVNNALKHAHCSRIDISLRDDGHEVLLSIVDDGSGLQVSPDRQPGMGLRIMRHRAHLIGARIEVGATPLGWRVDVTLPRPISLSTPEKTHADIPSA
jgi:PAS domain S-box-containing protein